MTSVFTTKKETVFDGKKFFFTCNAPTWKVFEELGVSEASPSITVKIVFVHKRKRVRLICEIGGHYYCSGSRNFDIESLTDKSADYDLDKPFVESIIEPLTSELDLFMEGTVLWGDASTIIERIFKRYC